MSAGWRGPDSLPPVFGMFPHTLPLSKVSQQKKEGMKEYWDFFVCFVLKKIVLDVTCQYDLILFDTNIEQPRR